MGRQPQLFETSICEQEELPFEGLEAFLVAAAGHNTGINESLIEDAVDGRGE